MPQLDLQILDPSLTSLARPLRRILSFLHIKHGSWSIKFVRDEQMADIHWQTLLLPTTTDVLTFDLRDHPHPPYEGSLIELDTVICLDEARRRAKELGHPLRHELLLYCIHSLLHVQGYDDITPPESRRMHAREDELLAAIGIGPVYTKHKNPNAKRKRIPVKNRNSKSKNRKSRTRRAP
jgi:probable rRNA maturation factor